MVYKIEVAVYEGPFDLLLSLIQKSEIDIYDIPIDQVTHQFLDYISKMDELNLEVTSEFLVVAATLLEIKSKMLLPQEKIEEDGILIEVDPREALVQRLIEYKLYKEAAQELKASETIESGVYYKPREDLSIYSNPIEELGKIDLAQLVKTINNIISRSVIKSNILDIEEIKREEYTLENCIGEIELKLLKQNKFLFTDLLSEKTSKEEIIVYFLSLLELIRLRSVYVYQDSTFSDLMIKIRLKEE